MEERDTIHADGLHQNHGKQKRKNLKTNAEYADGRTASVTIMGEEPEGMKPSATEKPYQILDG